MKQWVCTAIAALGLATATQATEGIWSAGLRTQGYWDFEPGNDYVSGVEFGYSNYNLASHRLQLKAAYLTSRLEQVFRENIARQDYFLFSPVWHFRRNAFFDPTVQADLGYMLYDTEFDFLADLDNDTWIAALQAGFNLNLAQGQYGAFYHFGYNFAPSESSLVFPGVFGLGLWMTL